MISAIAGRLRRMGLPTDAIVGIQMPNIVENILTILGVLRAGLIAAPLPLLWRRADMVTALARVGAKALIACRRCGGFEHCQLATHVAAEVFSIRYVGGFGAPLPDGVVSFDDLFTAAKLDAVPPLDRDRDAAAHLAVTTFEVGEDGPVPVARRHLELLAGGLCALLESRMEQDASVLSAVAPSSFAGICLTLVPWLLSGGTLSLHHPFDAEVFARQRRDERAATLILPAAVAFRLAETGLFAREGPTTVLAAWYAPERLAAAAEWPARDAVLVDVPIFGEAGFVAARRGVGGRPVPIPLGAVAAPRGLRTRWRSSNWRRPKPIPWRCVVRWCRGMSFHRASSAPTSRISRFPATALSTVASPAGWIPEPDHRCHRAAVRPRQCRRLSLPALRASGNDRPHRCRRGAGGAARSAERASAGRYGGRSQCHGGRVARARGQSAGHRGVRRARRACFARGRCRRISASGGSFLLR